MNLQEEVDENLFNYHFAEIYLVEICTFTQVPFSLQTVNRLFKERKWL